MQVFEGLTEKEFVPIIVKLETIAEVNQLFSIVNFMPIYEHNEEVPIVLTLHTELGKYKGSYERYHRIWHDYLIRKRQKY